MAESQHHILNDEELRILLSYCLKRLPASVLRDLQGSAENRQRALAVGTDIVISHLRQAKHEVLRPPALAGHGDGNYREG
jgi:hypothetical protein